MSKRNIRSWAYKQMRNPVPDSPNWFAVGILILIVAAIVLKLLGVL